MNRGRYENAPPRGVPKKCLCVQCTWPAIGQLLTSHNRTGLAAKGVQNCQMKKNTKYILFVYMRRSYKAKDITLGPRHKNKTFYDLL